MHFEVTQFFLEIANYNEESIYKRMHLHSE